MTEHTVGAGFVVFENFPVVHGPDDTLDTHVKRDVDFYEADLLMRNAYDTYALLFGPSFKHLDQTNDIFGQIVSITQVNERLRAGYYGAAIGIATDHTPSDRWTMRSQNLISVYYSDFVSDADETVDIGVENLFLNNAFSASQNGYALGIKSRLAFGHTLSNGWDFDLVLTGQYLSQAPFIKHGQIGSIPADNIRSLDEDSIFGGSVTVSLSKSF